MPEEDRRLVSVLFCDLVGFTPLSERLDAEEVREVQDAYFALMSAEIERFGGTVEKYAGDAVLAIFGAPLVHEDDAERAVRCALRMHQALLPLAEETLSIRGVSLALRIGVNTGEVVSGLREGGGRRDYAVTGDAVNTAARFQTAADPGSVMVGELTMQLARRGIAFGEKTMLTLKGKSEPVPGYPVLGLRARLAERWELTTHHASLVGRNTELRLLDEAWDIALQHAGTAVEISAEPGVGKSRLLAEACGRFSASGPMKAIRGRCLSYSTQLSLWLIADILRNIFGLSDHATVADIAPGITVGVETVLGTAAPEERAIAMDVFGESLGLPPAGSMLTDATAQVRRHGLVRSLRSMLEALSAQTPILLVLEDLHWVDGASRDVLAEVLAVLPSLRVLVVTTRRPEGESLLPGSSWARSVPLEPLRLDDAMHLASAVLGGVRLSPALQKEVANRAGGNPFFVEELLRELQESDALEERNGETHLRPGVRDRLPSSLQEVLLARLDRLDRNPRAVAQVGSVIGRTFAVPLLAGTLETEEPTLEAPLDVLQRAEIVLPQTGSDREYAFKHATMQEAAYQTLLKKHRQALHAATARAVIRLFEGDEYIDIVAYHFAQTDDHVAATEWLERSADRAAAVYANELAVERYRETRRRQDLINAPPGDRARVNEKLGHILRLASRYDEALETLEQGVQAYQDAEDPEGERRTVAETGRVHRARGTTDVGIASIADLLNQRIGIAPSAGLAALHVVLARLYFTLGKYEEEVEAAALGAELSSVVGDRRVLVEAEMSRSIALYHLGRTEDALTVMEAAIPVAEEVGEFEVLANLLNNVAMIYREAGDFGRSSEYRERCAEVNERIGDLAMQAFALAGLGEVIFFQGDWTQAQAYLERAVTMVRSLGASWYFFLPLALLAQLYVARGEFELASVCLEEALETARENGQYTGVRGIIDRLAECDLVQGNAEMALRRFDGVLNLSALDEGDATLTASLPILAWAYLENGEAGRAASLARLGMKRAVEEHAIVDLLIAERIYASAAGRQEMWEEAGSHFQLVLALARQVRYPYAEALVLYEWGLMCLGQRDNRQAVSRLTKAHDILRRLGANPFVRRVEQALTGAGYPAPLQSAS